MRTDRSIRRSSPWHVLLAIVLIVSGRLLAALHEADAGHVVCPEHGEVLHVAHVEVDSSSDVPVSPGPLVRPVTTAEGHEHCVFAGWFAEAQTSWCHPDAWPWRAQGASWDTSIPRTDTRHVREPLSFAPKHSPPARAT